MRFAIRDLLWLTVVAALAVAWWVDRSRLRADHAKAERELRQIADDQEIMLLRFVDAWEGDPRSKPKGIPSASALRDKRLAE